MEQSGEEEPAEKSFVIVKQWSEKGEGRVEQNGKHEVESPAKSYHHKAVEKGRGRVHMQAGPKEERGRE